MSDFKIALYIGGTRIRHGGMGYILSVGGLAGNENEGEIDMPPISRAVTQENPVITLKNAENYVYYKLWDSSIAPSDDEDNPGRLAICMTIPSNTRMKDGKSPYNLLMEVYYKFLELGTIRFNDSQRVFRNVDLDKGDFVKIIERYPLEDVSVKIEAMRGTTIAEIQVPQDKMEDFFRDTQYPEFVNYKAVEVTTKGKNMFPTLQIPRDPSYEIFINGNSTGNYVKDLKEPVDAYFTSTDDVKYDRMHSSLEELIRIPDHTKRNQNNTVVIQLDENRRRIDCTLTPHYVTYKKKLVYTSDTDRGAEDFIKEGLSNNTIKLMLDGEEWSYAVKPSVAIAAKKNNTIDIHPHIIDNYELSVDHVRIDQFDEQVIVHIRAIRTHQHGNEEDMKPEDGQSNRKFWKGFAIGIAIGLILGIGGLSVWQYYKGKMEIDANNKELKRKEKAEYEKIIKLPRRNPQTNLDQDDEYLTFLQSNEGAKPYRDYLKEYSSGNTVCYNQEHFFDVSNRLSKYREDSTDYANFLDNKRKLLEEANNALAEIQKKYGETSPKYNEIINLCNEYDSIYPQVSQGNTKKVDSIRNKATEKQTQIQKGEEEKRKIEAEALVFLNKNDYSGYSKWENKNKLTDYQKYAIEWILNYDVCLQYMVNNGKITGPARSDKSDKIKDYLNSIGFPNGDKRFNEWKDVKEVKGEIDILLRG